MFIKKQNIKCLDFNHSSVSWKLKNTSRGLFKIDSMLIEKKKSKAYFLAKTVMAGNVYGESILPIRPNYNFQWITNGKKKIVFRIFKNNEIKIDTGKKRNIDKYVLNIKHKKKKHILIKNLIENYSYFNNDLTCRIDFGNQICEFPVNHINIDAKNNNFQVETGPILLKRNKNYIPAFIFFNSMQKCQLVWYYPKLEGEIEETKVKINFFIDA